MDGAKGLTRDELARYARHLVLPEVGTRGQERLKASRVLLVGAGGLGSPAALYLAAAGVGTIGIIDPDVVDLTNLQRQIVHSTSGVDRLKVDSAKDRLNDVNPHVSVEAYPERLTSDNALGLFEGYDVVVDGTDNFPTRYLVNDACVLTGKPNVFGSVYRWEGQLSVFAAADGPCYRCLFREPPPAGLIPNCAEAGVFGALPGVIGAAQAIETIKVILGVGEPLVGRFQIFDAMTYRWRDLEIRRDPACPVCGDEPTQTGLIDYEVFCGHSRVDGSSPNGVVGIQPGELPDIMASDPTPTLLDVREPFEWQVSNLAALGAILVPRGEVESRLEEIPKERPVVVYCQGGGRSIEVAGLLVEQGFTGVMNLEGGIMALPIVPSEE